MGHTIAVMITKGGVGKSTLVMALAETLSAYHGKRVLVVDSDSQSSVSSMLMENESLKELQEREKTVSDFLSARVLEGRQVDWRDYMVEEVCDVDDARTVSLLPGSIQLALFEREVSAKMRFAQLSAAVAGLIRELNRRFDLVLVDCPPALTFLTEAWIRQADYHLSPTKPDYLGLHGLDILQRFQGLNTEQGFSKRLGVLVNMLDDKSPVDRKFHEVLMGKRDYRCFAQAIPAHASVRNAAVFHPALRSYMAKYPGIGPALRRLSEEVLERLESSAQAERSGPSPLASGAG